MMTLHTTLSVAALLLCTSFARSQPTSLYLYGIHDHDPDPGEFFNVAEANGRTVWVTATVAIGHNPGDFGGVDFRNISSRGHTVICRINNAYCEDGTIPLPESYDDFAQRCANFVANSQGCQHWIIGNETNLAVEWPHRGSAKEYVSPQLYADCFRKCYNAIKAVDPDAQVISQALAPFAGPYGNGSVCGYSHTGVSINWVTYLNQMLTAIAATGPLDGIALHINSRGYDIADIHSTQQVNAAGQLLYFSFYVYKDWVDFGIPSSLYHLPLYATECNGIYYWKGGFPGAESETYQAGWVQEIYAEIDRYNQQAITQGKPIYRCINMYRWCATCDGWNIDGSPQEAQILSDFDAAYDVAYQWPTAPLPLAANFSASPTTGPVPLSVDFTDRSTGNPTRWMWTFGDGGSSSQQNPAHSYQTPGTYSVSLTVQDASDSDALTQSDLINVLPPLGPGDELMSNGNFSSGLDSWVTWIERDGGSDFSVGLINGVMQQLGSNYNAGVYQQFATGGAGIRIEVEGNWASDPMLPSAQWGEVLLINSARTPVDGVDESDTSSADNALIYKNDTWLNPSGWFGFMSQTAPQGEASAISAAEVATLVLKSGNVGSGLTGVLFDNITVRIAAAIGDFDGDGAATPSDFAGWQDCLTGPGNLPAPVQPAATGTRCLAAFDFNADDDVDMADCAALMQLN
jgi:PKD repeat protein